jgi:ELWxxDGT repeat protein
MKRLITGITILYIYAIFGSAIAQPVFVKDVHPSSSNFTEVGSTLYFTTGDSLWKSDGTSAGTVLVKNGLMDPGNLFVFNGILYFLNDRVGTYPYEYRWNEIWKSDGTLAGTIMLKRSDAEEIQLLKGIGANQYFTVITIGFGRELWKTSGTLASTQLVKDIRPGVNGSITETFSEVIGSDLYFVANSGTTGEELWKSNGTNAGTVLVKDINPGAGNGVRVDFASSAVANNTLFFVGTDGVNGAELWKSNGTSAGTVLVKNVNPSTSDFFSDAAPDLYSDYFPPVHLTNVNGTIFFVPLHTIEGAQDYVHLYKSNGTEAGTVLVKKVPLENVDNFLSLNGRLVFTGYYGISYEVWSSDGTSGGTQRIKANERFGDNYLGGFYRVGTNLVFTDNVQGYAYQLWKTDGTVGGTQMIRQMNSAPGEFEEFNTTLFFTEHGAETYFESGDGINDYELWQSDLTTEGTFMVKNIADTSFAGSFNLKKVAGSLFFTTGYPVNRIFTTMDSTKLWKYTPDAFVVHELTLVNSSTDADIRALKNYDTIYTDQTVSIRAKKFGSVGSVRFFINDVVFRTENVAPFALAGDESGDYNEWMKSPGLFKITAIPYAGSGASGVAGDPFIKYVRVISPADTITDLVFTLVNADADTDIRNLINNDIIDYDGSPRITIRANYPSTVGSVVFFLNGTRFWTENAAPYALRGDESGNYAPWFVSYGNYTLTATAYSGTNGTGTLINSRSIEFAVVNVPGAARVNNTQNIEMYPNPTAERLSISLSGTETSITDIMILDPSGNIYYEGNYSNLGASSEVSFDLNELQMNSGLYFVKIKSSDNQERVVKLIKN